MPRLLYLPGAMRVNTRFRRRMSLGSTVPTVRHAAQPCRGNRHERGSAFNGDGRAGTNERGWPGPPPDSRRPRVLDLPAVRYHHVLGVLRHVRGVEYRHQRRTGPCATVRYHQRGHRDGVPVGFELCLWNGLARSRRAQPDMDPDIPARDRDPGCRVPGTGVEGIRKPGRTGRRTHAQRLSLVLLHARGLPWRTHNRGTAVAGDDDGAVLCQGLPGEHPAPLSVLQPVLACPGHHLDCDLQSGLPQRDTHMTTAGGVSPGDVTSRRRGVRTYLIG